MSDDKYKGICQNDLTPLLQEIVGLIGLPITLTLLRERGGTFVHFPKQLTPDHWLIGIVGQAAAVALAERFCGETMVLPLAAKAMRCLRNREILLLYDEGVPTRQIALRFGLNEVTVYRVLGNPGLVDEPKGNVFKGDPRQLRMDFSHE